MRRISDVLMTLIRGMEREETEHMQHATSTELTLSRRCKPPIEWGVVRGNLSVDCTLIFQARKQNQIIDTDQLDACLCGFPGHISVFVERGLHGDRAYRERIRAVRHACGRSEAGVLP